MARHRYFCPLRWSDMDVYGVINNVMFLRLLEEARVDFIWRLGSAGRDAFFGGGSVVVHHEIRYRKPLMHRPKPVEIEMWVSELRAATVTIDYEVRDGVEVYASASTTMAPYDYASRRPRRMKPEESAFFDQYLEPQRALT